MKYTDPDGNDISSVTTNPSFWTGLGILIGTIVEDIATLGAGIADDPATLAIGATLVMTAYECSKSNDRSVPYVNAETKVKEGNKGPYSVKVQFQGPSVKGESRASGEGCVEVNLRSDKPIPASAVEFAVSEKYFSLSKKEQAALAGSYNKVMNRIENAAKNGGCGPDYKSFQSNTGKPGDRCDFLTTGELNLVP